MGGPKAPAWGAATRMSATKSAVAVVPQKSSKEAVREVAVSPKHVESTKAKEAEESDHMEVVASECVASPKMKEAEEPDHMELPDATEVDSSPPKDFKLENLDEAQHFPSLGGK